MVGIKMEDSNNWEARYVNCKYADRLVNKLVELNQQVTIPVNMNEVKKGIYYAKKYHGSQMRQSGDPYYSHPIEVAYMVSDHLYRTDIIVTSILHDTIEDTKLTRSMIASVFGEHIASQVEDLSRNKPHGKISSAETLNILFQQKKYDVLLIKLFDRLHNLQTIGAKSSEKARKTIVETLSRFMSLSMYYNTPTIEQNFAELCSKVIHTYYKTNN
ncbi:HD domain-containing protein [Candidatus Tisiphia endosymbiont of Dioctria rufipes]|uniref:HD domain-containing protein n=2 Tax=unclassified Candidatus Tisiphia TaxID=2996318 RepID=UPI0039776507